MECLRAPDSSLDKESIWLFFIKHIQIRLGVFISANPNKLFHFSTWQNNQENIVLSVPAAPSTSQSHCS